MTTLHVKNETTESVLVFLTLGATPGCVQDVGLLTFTPAVELVVIAPLMGSFELAPGLEVEVTAPAGDGLNGNFSFGTPPLNCPCQDWPEGVCLAEFIVNNGFQPGGQETVDISGVCGANAFLRINLSEDDWTSNGGAIAPVKSFANETRFRNTGLVGVYPYGCDNCTSSDNPPACVGQHPEFANADPICNVQRSAGENLGGAVRVSFLGWTPVPA
jgi:hypothetical protein